MAKESMMIHKDTFMNFEEYSGKNYYDYYDKAIWTHVRKVNK